MTLTDDTHEMEKSLNLTLKAPIPQNGQTHSNNLQIADELFECVWPFCESGA